MKKGIQYSHYCGTELQELQSSLRLAEKMLKNAKIEEESLTWIKHSKIVVKDLRDKISFLDKLNDMKY
jgi:DNA-directed RNA polymerase subunit H (RpoH/RPB5)